MEMRQVKVIHPTVVIIAIDDIHCIHKHTHTLRWLLYTYIDMHIIQLCCAPFWKKCNILEETRNIQMDFIQIQSSAYTQ